MQKIREGGVEISVPRGVFYNPKMELCRDMFSLAVGSLGAELEVVDAMCASGVRGIRYAKENSNVSSLALCDLSSRAAACARKNARLNRIKCKVANEDACEFLRENEYGFVELDPFGSPMPFLYDAVRSWRKKKAAYLSVTATDMAVLCGADRAACLKHYGATPLNNEFAHENAVRLLAAKVVLTAAPFNFSAQPLLSFSHLHYVKLLFRMEKSAASALNSVKSLGFVSYCEKCCFRKAGRVADEGGCPECGNPLRWGGPFYLGDLWDGKLLERMLKLNAERAYSRKGEIGKVLLTMLSESRINACGYYDLHVLARRMKAPIRSMDAALERLRNGGFLASRTHFCPTAVRTDAPHGAVLGLLG